MVKKWGEESSPLDLLLNHVGYVSSLSVFLDSSPQVIIL